VNRLLIPAALLLLIGCNQPQDDLIEPVPTQSAESANRLMSAAEDAAGNAQARMGAVPQANDNLMENGQ
jgi:uncharacterized lipoprotein YajG